MMRFLPIVFATLLSACVAPPPPPTERAVPRTAVPDRVDPRSAARNFAAVVAQVEPVAERECRARTPRRNCDFRIVVDDRPGRAANAFQTLDKDRRPVIVFTLALIAEARNRDELAFVLGHEAAHHIRGHLPRVQQTAIAGAVIFGTVATLSGAGIEDVRAAQQTGAQIGARTHSKEFELEADALGTIIAYRAGYDPRRGAEFFSRIPDPGDRFLASHPPNAERRAIVLRTYEQLQ